MSKICAAKRAEARALYRDRRSAIADEMRKRFDEARRLNLEKIIGDAQKVAIYLSAPPEPDTIGFVRSWPRPLYVPVLRTFPKTKSPDWVLLDPGRFDELTRPGWQGIPEPTLEPLADEISPDVIVVSALAADKDGNRLGTGGGWFDRALSRLPQSCLRVCLLYADEIVDEVEALPHDNSVDVLVTESGCEWSTVSSRI
ncbi:5-formyltetrahydrofolate cyclo-ligase [Propionimicrobium sp. BV2F7]|uniref:5-formyltetrahydrofolate cyclo-ligase n=1 Tax=Propionimicrobium sp. BV2F7 TaxID=1111131 RepID=UPI0006849F67|nr:5-formyltetrahydrofolate cyclo-ligase [Propionimicrobium sp. BV2F7]